MGISDSRTLGSRAEQIALDHLLARNLTLLERNFRCRLGEIDLIMLDSECLVFVEVRYRKLNRFASATVSVDSHKQRKLIKAAGYYLSRHRYHGNRVVRFDVVALDGPTESQSTLQWLQDAFRT